MADQLTTDTETQESTEQSDFALTSWAAHMRIWITGVIGLALDLISKSMAFDRLSDGRPHVLIENVLSFQTSRNPGALFGMGKGLSHIFVAASVFAVFFVFYVFAKSHRLQRSFHIALGMVMAGAMGNLYDRVMEQGAVRDFIKIELALGQTPLWPWVFNVADMMLVVGVGILLINIWFQDPNAKRLSDVSE